MNYEVMPIKRGRPLRFEVGDFVHVELFSLETGVGLLPDIIYSGLESPLVSK